MSTTQDEPVGPALPDRKTLMKDWPKHGGDVSGATVLLAHGYPALTPVLKDIVQWTIAGSVAPLFCKFLRDVGEPAVEPVRLALKGTNDLQILHLLCDVLPGWPRSALLAVSGELEMLLQRGSVFGLHIFALALLVRAKAKTHAPAAGWASEFRKRLNAQREALDQIYDDLLAEERLRALRSES